jgi:hypothetical protein
VTAANGRAERTRLIARRVSDRIADVAPPGLGHWPDAWELVAAPSRAFLDALECWERTGTKAAEVEVTRLARQVVEAWSEAAREWTLAGCPSCAKLEESPRREARCVPEAD